MCGRDVYVLTINLKMTLWDATSRSTYGFSASWCSYWKLAQTSKPLQSNRLTKIGLGFVTVTLWLVFIEGPMRANAASSLCQIGSCCRGWDFASTIARKPSSEFPPLNWIQTSCIWWIWYVHTESIPMTQQVEIWNIIRSGFMSWLNRFTRLSSLWYNIWYI